MNLSWLMMPETVQRYCCLIKMIKDSSENSTFLQYHLTIKALFIYYTFNKPKVSELVHAGIVCDTTGVTVKLTGPGTTCAPTLQLPALCCGAQESHISPGCHWSSTARPLMLGKCQARTSQVHWALNAGSGAQHDSDMITDGGCDTCKQWLHTAIWSALRHCQETMTTGAWCWRW